MTHGMSFALGNIHMFVRGRPLRFAVGPGQPATPPRAGPTRRPAPAPAALAATAPFRLAFSRRAAVTQQMSCARLGASMNLRASSSVSQEVRKGRSSCMHVAPWLRCAGTRHRSRPCNCDANARGGAGPTRAGWVAQSGRCRSSRRRVPTFAGVDGSPLCSRRRVPTFAGAAKVAEPIGAANGSRTNPRL